MTKDREIIVITKDNRITGIGCKLDHSDCDHEWEPKNQNPEYCQKCGTSFIAYTFMECP